MRVRVIRRVRHQGDGKDYALIHQRDTPGDKPDTMHRTRHIRHDRHNALGAMSLRA